MVGLLAAGSLEAGSLACPQLGSTSFKPCSFDGSTGAAGRAAGFELSSLGGSIFRRSSFGNDGLLHIRRCQCLVLGVNFHDTRVEQEQ